MGKFARALLVAPTSSMAVQGCCTRGPLQICGVMVTVENHELFPPLNLPSSWLQQTSLLLPELHPVTVMTAPTPPTPPTFKSCPGRETMSSGMTVRNLDNL